MHEWGLEEIPTSPTLAPKFINKPGSSFLAMVLMRDDRDPNRVHSYLLSAVEPLECVNDKEEIVAIGPGEIFACEGHVLTPYFGLTINLEVTAMGGAHITVDKHETPTEPPPSTERSRP